MLVQDTSGAKAELSQQALPLSLREGDVIRVRRTTDGEPDWPSAIVDPELRRQRLQDALAAIERLKRRDPGGDVDL